MTGNVISIDLSLANIWHSWKKFRRGKKRSFELEHFSYYLEDNLFRLHADLNDGAYRHGGYRVFYVTDNKRRRIAVASIRDRVVHRLLYEYLVSFYDKTFIRDVWSCRKNKGLVGAIERTQGLLKAYPKSYIWRSDVVKFFDSVNRDILFRILQRSSTDPRALTLLHEVLKSAEVIRERVNSRSRTKGLPIGNLTSQIFANIYLNEFDQYVVRVIKPLGYIRYGDDFIVIAKTREEAEHIKNRATVFLEEKMHLVVHAKNNVIVRAKYGVRFLGMWIYAKGRVLNRRNLARIKNRLTIENVPSYSGLVKKHMNLKYIRAFQWDVLRILEEEVYSIPNQNHEI